MNQERSRESLGNRLNEELEADPVAASERDDDDRREAAGSAGAPREERTALLNDDVLEIFRSRWEEVQAGFVDDPREAVATADSLVGDVMRSMTDVFARERQTLEDQWSSNGDASTEDLRVALQRYRSFFQRLLAT